VELRFKHYQARMIDTLNKILTERKQIKNKLLAKLALPGYQTSRPKEDPYGL